MINGFSLLDKKGLVISLKSAIKKYSAEEFQLLSLLLMNYSISKEDKVSGMLVVNELAGDSETKNKMLKQSFLKLLEKEKDLETIITESKGDFVKEIKKKEDYIIMSEDGKIQNKLFDLLEKASQKMKFKFGKAYPLQIARNVKTMKQLLTKLENLEEPKTFNDVEDLYNKVYSIYIYDNSIYKSILPFTKFCEDYFILGDRENIENKIKGIYFYVNALKKKATPQVLGNAYTYFGKFALDIIYAIDDDNNLTKYNKLLKDFSTDYHRKGLTWTLKTLNEKLYSDKELSKKYLANKNEQVISLGGDNIKKISANNNYEKDFSDFMIKIKENNPHMQSKLYKIYKKSGIEGLEKVIN